MADGALDLMTFLKAVTLNPAELLDLPQGRLCEGAPADIVLLDPHKPWVVDSDALISKSNNTPFDDRRLTGKAVMTMCNGRIVFSEL